MHINIYLNKNSRLEREGRKREEKEEIVEHRNEGWFVGETGGEC